MFVGSLESEHTSRHGTKGKWIDAEFHKEKKSEFIDYSWLVFFPFFLSFQNRLEAQSRPFSYSKNSQLHMMVAKSDTDENVLGKNIKKNFALFSVQGL